MRFSLSRSLRRAAALVVVALLLVPVVGGSGAWFTDSRSVSGSASAATLGALSPTVAAAGAGNTVSWPAATTQSWASDAKVTDGVTYAVQRQIEGRPAQSLGTTSGTSFTDPGGQPFGMVSAGESHSLAVSSDGAVWAWGAAWGLGQGAGSMQDSRVPKRVDALWNAGVRITQVSARDHSLAVASDGSLWAWGINSFGELGDGSRLSSAAPKRVDGLWNAGVRVTQVSVGESYTVAVSSDGAVWAWGLGTSGQLGDGDSDTHIVSSPRRVDVLWDSGVRVSQISAGASHVLAVASDGSLWAWGGNASGQFGDGTNISSPTPKRLDALWGSGVRVVQASAGKSSSTAVDSDGAVWTWGYGSSGLLGRGQLASSSVVPKRVDALWDQGVRGTQATMNEQHAMVVASDGSVWSWGYGSQGRLGDGELAPHIAFVPKRIDALWNAGTRMTQVSAGSGHSLAVASDGTLWSWGSAGLSGKLGTGTTTSQALPGLIGGRTFAQVSAGTSHSLAVDSRGEVWAWGSGASGELGNGGSEGSPVPVPVSATWGDGVSITQVSAGTAYSLALDSAGSVWIWGSGSLHDLGGGIGVDSAIPVRVMPIWGESVVFSQVSAGKSHALALDSTGSLWAWGRDTAHQLGLGHASTGLQPDRVQKEWPSGVTITQMSAGGEHSLAVDSRGVMWAWGRGRDGQLGVDVQVSEVPIQISVGSPPGAIITQVSAGAKHSLAIDSHGSVWAWGRRGNGALGNGGYNSSNVPVPVIPTWGSDVTITQVSAGDSHSMALDSRGQIWGWGGGSRAGSSAVAPKPVRMSTASEQGVTVLQISAGASHWAAVDSRGSAWAWGQGDDGRLGDGDGAYRSTPVLTQSLAPTLVAANCALPSTLIGRFCTLPGTTTYSVSYRYLGWSSPLATATITR